MARYALVHSASGFVANVIVIEDVSTYTPPTGYEMVPDPDPAAASPGYSWDGSAFTPPPTGAVKAS